jgi:UDP-N-acetyl-D-glucosamine dehydrogenase
MAWINHDQESSLHALKKRIQAKTAVIGIFGSGYAGLPLACTFAQAGYLTIASDTDARKVEQIRKGSSYVEDVHVEHALPTLVASGKLEATTDLKTTAARSDFTIITVPTPLTDELTPDLSYVVSVAEVIESELRPGRFVIVESSVYPGATDEVVKPILERGGLRAGKDFGLANSPERVDYGNPTSILDIPKVVGGVTPLCTKLAADLYSKILRARVVPVFDARTAETTKMIENTYRYVNIALANEFAIACEALGVDVYEVITAAASKPFGFQPFYPGPGVGGHCIPKDPHYFSFKTRQVGVPLRLLELSTTINEGMADHIIRVLTGNLTVHNKKLEKMKAAILGLAFKADVSDARRSPAIAIAEKLSERYVEVSAYDPLAKPVETRNGPLVSEENVESAVKDADLLFLVTPHKIFRTLDLHKIAGLMHSGAALFDTRGFWTRAECEKAGFVYFCLGRPLESQASPRVEVSAIYS